MLDFYRAARLQRCAEERESTMFSMLRQWDLQQRSLKPRRISQKHADAIDTLIHDYSTPECINSLKSRVFLRY
jgi:hypothetical protein